MIDHEGWRLVPVVLVPVVITGVAAMARWSSSRKAIWIGAAVLLGGLVLLGLLSIGVFFVPSLIALGNAAIRAPDRDGLRGGRGSEPTIG